MPAPGEHKTVQARILAYAQEIGWTYVPREEASDGAVSIPTALRLKTALGWRLCTSTICSMPKS